MKRIVGAIQVALLVLCWVPNVCQAECEAVGEGGAALLVGLVAAPVSVAFILANLGELVNDDPNLTIAEWGLGVGGAATWAGVKLLECDNRGIGWAATGIGATCSVLSAINMYRASRNDSNAGSTLKLEPDIWLDPHRRTVLGVRIYKSF